MKNAANSPGGSKTPLPDSLWVAFGGVLGTLSRYGVEVHFATPHTLHPGFPWTTFAINVCGAAVLGFVMAWFEETKRHEHWLRLFAGVGFCGSFTTFSSVTVEILLHARDGEPGVAIAYLSASLICGILAVALATNLALRILKKHDLIEGGAQS